MKYNNTERTGIASVNTIFARDLNWIFRENTVNDFGIDAFVEITTGFNGDRATGKLIGVQIKSGRTYFREEKKEHFVFRGEMKHLAYWLGHSIPVILVIYDEDTRTAYWREINNSTVILTPKSFKIDILKRNVLGKSSKEALAGIAFFKNSHQYKIWQLQTSADEIRLLIKNQLFLYVEIDSIPRSDFYGISLVVSDFEAENVPEYMYNYEGESRFEYAFYLFEDNSLAEAISDTIPWADLFIEGAIFTDEELTTQLADQILSYEQEEFTEDVLEMKRKNAFLKLACYISGSICLKINLKPNELTHAFLLIDAFLTKGPIVKNHFIFNNYLRGVSLTTCY